MNAGKLLSSPASKAKACSLFKSLRNESTSQADSKETACRRTRISRSDVDASRINVVTVESPAAWHPAAVNKVVSAAGPPAPTSRDAQPILHRAGAPDCR